MLTPRHHRIQMTLQTTSSLRAGQVFEITFPPFTPRITRRRAPTVLMPAEIKVLVDGLGIRERTLVLLAVSTGLRQSEWFGLKWGDIDLVQYTMNVTRSIVYGVVGPCKTESSQKPVPIHPRLADALSDWRNLCVYTKPDDWVLPAGAIGVGDRIGGKRSCANTCRRLHRELESRNASAGTRFGSIVPLQWPRSANRHH
jgi:integrase